MLHVVLIEPEIPPNTGNIGRLCLATGSRLHLVEPLGFSLSEKEVRRAGLDYWKHVDPVIHPSMDAFLGTVDVASQCWLVTTKGRSSYTEPGYRDGDYLVFGRESKGLPESLLSKWPSRTRRIPMDTRCVRSLNLATSAGIVLYEAIRQMGGGGIFWQITDDGGSFFPSV